MPNTIITNQLNNRCGGLCELCDAEEAVIAFAVSPRNHDSIENEVALCIKCEQTLNNEMSALHWQCLRGSIWSTEPSVQALVYRILYGIKTEDWAIEILSSVELDEWVISWALTAFQKQEPHKDSNGTSLQNGDTVILIQALNIKGANFTAPKGTIIRKIRLVHDNTEQIEGKINDQTIVILTRYVRKS